MSEHDAASIGRSYDCKTPDCTGASRSPVGRYSYCDHCRERRAKANVATTINGEGPAPKTARSLGFEVRVKALTTAGRNADKLAAHAKKLTERALAAKANADKAADEVRRAARELIDA